MTMPHTTPTKMDDDKRNDDRAAEDDAPTLTGSSSSETATSPPMEQEEPTTLIRRSTYTSDVENNDCLNDVDASSPVMYTGSTTHGIVHVIDSTSKQPTAHLWLGNIQFWPMVVTHFRVKNYDTFLFTPYSSKDNWGEMNPELRISGVIVPKGQGSEAASSSPKSAANKYSVANKSKGIRSYLSIIITLSLIACAVVAAVVIVVCVRFHYEYKMDLKTGGMHCADNDTGLFGEDQQQCVAPEKKMGLREKTAVLFGQEKKSIEEHAQALISWLEKEGGYLHPKLQMRRVDPSDQKSYFGLFADEFIPKDEILIRVPQSMVLSTSVAFDEVRTMTCGTVRTLINELKLKDDSKYAPYVNYLIDTQPPGCPSAWSEAGKALLTRVLRPSDSFRWVDEWVPPAWSGATRDFLTRVVGAPKEIIELPPHDPLPWLDVWHNDCEGSDDPLEEYAALIVIQRSWDAKLIPVLDMMSHGNGNLLNTAHSDVHDIDTDIELKAKRDIEANEQIHTSYNMCENCGSRKYNYGTGDILREYGFVEQMPQSFYFEGMEFGFRVDENQKESGKGKGYGMPYVTDWVNKKPSAENVETMEQMLEQIKKTKAKELSVNYDNVNSYEWEMIKSYVNALENGLKAAVRGAQLRKGDLMRKGDKIEVIGTEELADTEVVPDDGSSDDSDESSDD
ncbi:hypothetical protein ACHAXM_007788 [Skeletonema potamos]